MFTKFRFHFKLFLPFIFVILINCQIKESTNNHGILYLENRAGKLEINKSNRNDAIDIIGYPHSKAIDNENEWIYIERVFVKGKYHRLGRNILKTNNVLFLKFDKFGILKDKEIFNKEDINKMTFSKKETENDLSKTSFVESFFSSLRAKMYGKK